MDLHNKTPLLRNTGPSEPRRGKNTRGLLQQEHIVLPTVLGTKLGAGYSVISTEWCSEKKVITAAGRRLRVRIQKSQKARKKLGGWKRNPIKWIC